MCSITDLDLIIPHLVVLAFAGANDFADNLDDIWYGPSYPDRAYFVLSEGDLTKVSASPVLAFLARNSNIFRFLEGVFAYKFTHIFGVHVQENMKSNMEYYDPYNKRAKDGSEITQALIQTLNKEVMAYGGKLLIESFPYSWVIEKELYDKYAILYKEQFTELDLFYPINVIENYSIKNNIPFINLTKYFLAHKKNFPNEHIFIPHVAGHMTPMGAKLAGKIIAKEGIARGLIPCD